MLQWITQNWEHVVVAASLAATVVNAVVRALQDKGEAVPKFILALQAVVNALGFNGDKALQAGTGGRGPSQSAR